jgi:hypothetical protein
MFATKGFPNLSILKTIKEHTFGENLKKVLFTRKPVEEHTLETNVMNVIFARKLFTI